MSKWVKVYMTDDQHREWKSGNGKAIAYLEHEVETMRKLEKAGHSFSLNKDPLNHMTKLDPARLTPVGWSFHGVFID